MIVIVGNGPSPVGKRWGSRIDAAETVIRMADNDWQDAPDYGTKYTVGILCGPGRRLAWELEKTARRPGLWWLFNPHRLLTGIPENPVWHGVSCERIADGFADGWIGRLVASGAQNESGGRPALTRGFVAVIEARRRWPEEPITLVGFDVLETGVVPATSEGYPAAALKWRDLPMHQWKRGSTRNQSHDYGAEHAALLTMDVEWGFQ
jgi:hypothetical protein